MPPSGRAITVRKAEPMVGWCLFEYYREKAEKLKAECEAETPQNHFGNRLDGMFHRRPQNHGEPRLRLRAR